MMITVYSVSEYLVVFLLFMFAYFDYKDRFRYNASDVSTN